MSSVINKVIINDETKINLTTSTANEFEVVEDQFFYLPTGHLTSGRLVLDGNENYRVCEPFPIKSVDEVAEKLAMGLEGEVYKYTGQTGTDASGHLWVNGTIYIVEKTATSAADREKDELIKIINEYLPQLTVDNLNKLKTEAATLYGSQS